MISDPISATEPITTHRRGKVHPAGVWVEARELYEGGLSLQKVGQKLGLAFSTVRYHAWLEGWRIREKWRGPGPRQQVARAKEIRRKLAREEKRLEEELTIVKAEDLEILARKSLAADSARAKVSVSRLVKQTLEELMEPGVKAKERAATLQMLAPVIRLVHRWHEEPSVEGMERRGAINLALIATPPEELRRLRLPAVEDQSSLAAERRADSETE